MKNKFYVHDIPGRLRVKIPMLKGKTEMSDSVLGLFRNMTGVKNVSVNNVTGSVVFQYDPAVVRSNQILDTPFTPQAVRRNQSHIGRSIHRTCGHESRRRHRKGGHGLGSRQGV